MSFGQSPKLTRRRFLRLAGTAACAAAALGGCRRQPAPGPDDGYISGPSQTVIARGGTVKWGEFYSSLTPDQAAAAGIDRQANLDWMAGVVRQFTQESPGWQVVMEPIARDQMDQRSVYDFNGNVDHDLLFTTPQLMARHHKIGDLLDLSPLLGSLPGKEQQDLNWSAVWSATSVGGQHLGVPISLQAHGHVVNRDLFRKAGLDPERSLHTLDDIVATARTLTRPDANVWGLASFLGRGRALVEQTYAPIVWNYGGGLYDESRGLATFADDASVRAAQWLSDLVYTHKVVPPETYAASAVPSTAIAETFSRGRAAQALGFGSYWIGSLQSAGLVKDCQPANKSCAGAQVGVLPLPANGQAQYMPGSCLSVHKLSQQPEMAFRLLQVALRPDNLRAYPDRGLPVRLSLWKDPAYASGFYQGWLACARAGRSMPATPYYPELADTLAAALTQILTQHADPGTVLTKAEDDWNSKYGAA